MIEHYLNTKDICDRFRCSSRTIWRRMKREENPFPQPMIKTVGASNLWCAKEVAIWENKEIENTATERHRQEQAFICAQREKNEEQFH